MNEKEFYKRIKQAITLAMNRVYTGVSFDGDEKCKAATIRSLFNEYKRRYPFEDKK